MNRAILVKVQIPSTKMTAIIDRKSGKADVMHHTSLSEILKLIWLLSN